MGIICPAQGQTGPKGETGTTGPPGPPVSKCSSVNYHQPLGLRPFS